MRRVLAAVAATIALIAVSACDSSKPTAAGPPSTPASATSPSPSPSPSPSLVPAGADCPAGVEGATPVRFRSGNITLAGDVWGSGSVGIVFAHESDIDSCSWMGYARAAAKLGYRTLTFDFSGFGGSTDTKSNELVDDVTAAAAFLRSQGSTKIVLVGASMGGAAIVAAAPSITPPVAALVALSAPAEFGTAYATEKAAKITAPLLVICGEWDYGFVPSAHAIYDNATKSKHRQLLIVGSNLHGFRLVAPDQTPVPAAVKAMAKFLATYAPPGTAS